MASAGGAWKSRKSGYMYFKKAGESASGASRRNLKKYGQKYK